MRMQRPDGDNFATKSSRKSLGSESIVYQAHKAKASAFISDAQRDTSFPRHKEAKEYGICSVAIVPFQEGVIEYGTGERWRKRDKLPPLPAKQINSAFESAGA